MSKENGKRFAKTEKDVVYKYDLVEIPNARILPGSWKNFSGKNESGYNGQGRREITIKLNADFENPELNEEIRRVKDELLSVGYIIKVREPNKEALERDPNIQPLEYIKVQINCPGDHDDNPKWKKKWDSLIYTRTSKGIIPEPYNSKNMFLLDSVEIIEANLRVRPYTWTMYADKDGRIPYGYRPVVEKMVLTIKEDEFDKKYMS